MPKLPNIKTERATSWDERFLELAGLVASWSKDPSTKCGAVIVRPDKTVASVGYNGFPKGCDDDPLIYADRPLKYARVIHAEVNAVLHAREPLDGYSMYTYPASGFGPTCDRCATVVIQSGITAITHEFVSQEFDARWGEGMQRGLDMYDEAGVIVRHLEVA